VSGFVHFATVYRSDDEFVAQALPFIEEGIAADGALLVALDRRKIALLEEFLGPDAARVQFEDMRELGRNPGAIISAWQDFAQAHAGRSLWGIGEPAWPGRSHAELDECRQHECLLNAAFADAPDFRLLCPYDASGLDPVVIEGAFDSHPSVVSAAGEVASETYVATDGLGALLVEPLSAPPRDASELDFDLASLREVRELLRALIADAGIYNDTASDFVLSVNELAENSVRHGSGGGRLRVWFEADHLVADVSDDGRLSDPLAGRRRPGKGRQGGYGLWLTHQVCDLVQVRSSEAGTTVRAHVRIPVAA
jgi:anti-sigma regulatory factor (Ser/Thr protein kinase)